MKNTSLEPEELIFNAEVIRDFCGNCSGNLHTVCAEYLQVLPEAVYTLCSWFHFPDLRPVKDSQTLVWSILEKELENIIPLDCSKWDDLDLIRRVYRTVFSIEKCNLGARLQYACNAVMNSDYYKAERFIDNLDNEEMKKILSKAINGHKLYKVDLSSLGPYFTEYGELK